MVQIRRAILLAGTALSLFAAAVASSSAQEKIVGVPALAGAKPRASGDLLVRETGPFARELEIAMSDLATGNPLTSFEEELTQKLHVIAVDSALSTFIHEHAEEPSANGRFRVNIRFPQPGTYHVYADAVPTDLGQQVLRFDVAVGETASAGPANPSPQTGGVLRSSDGPFIVELATSGLAAGLETELTMRILKAGQPAGDLAPYLGVPAHAVFIAVKDLAYVHAHATAGTAGGDDHVGHGGTTEAIPPDLTLHVTPPHAGVYALWVQFMGGGEVRTVPFTIGVPEARS